MTRGEADGRGNHGSPSHSRLIALQLNRAAPRIAHEWLSQQTAIQDNLSGMAAQGHCTTSCDNGLRREGPSICPGKWMCALAHLALGSE